MFKKYSYIKIGKIYRPIIAIKFLSADGYIPFDGLIDSGAVYSLFPGWITRLLGHDVVKGKPYKCLIAGETIKAYSHDVRLRVENIEFDCNIYFSDDINDWKFGILGHVPLFEKFKISFNYSNKEFVLER